MLASSVTKCIERSQGRAVSMKEKPRKQVYCCICGKWLSYWHYVYKHGRMLPACPDDRLCERRRREGEHNDKD